MPRKKAEPEEQSITRPRVRWRVKPGKENGERVFFLIGDDEWWGTYDSDEEANAEKAEREAYAQRCGG